MDKSPTKKELLEIIKKQEEELQRYKKLFQDVVAVHKRLLKEKNALESSLKVMRKNQNPEIASVDLDCSVDDTSSTSSKVDESHSEDGGSSNESSDHLKAQLTTLMQSIATLSAEKSRMEASFQADRKALRVQKEEQENAMKELKKKLEHQAQTHLTEIENYKTKLMLERRQREKEHQDHGMMIRELQKLVEEERSKRESASKSVNDYKRDLIAAQSVAEVKEKELNSQVDTLKKRLLKEQDSSAPLLSSLQQELATMREQHAAALQKEQERAAEAERQTKKLVAMHEESVANLEARLAELSNTVGNYDRLKEEDQCAIQKLKDKLVQLELEHDQVINDEEENCREVETLVTKLKFIKSLIDETNKNSENPVDVQSVLFGDTELMNVNRYANSDHALCHEEYQALKNEFEEFKEMDKKSAVSFSPSRDDTRELEKVKKQLLVLSDRTRLQEMNLKDSIKHYDKIIEENQKVLKHEKEKWINKIVAEDQKHRAQLADLQEQLMKQRDRAEGLMAEKDKEISALKARFQSLVPSRVPCSTNRDHPTDEMTATRKDSTSSDAFDVTESRPMLHYVQELSRLQIDVAKLRKQKHNLESDLRDLQISSAEEKESLFAQIGSLTKNVARLERYQSREGANLEYLKNVVLSYLLTTDENRRSHMLNAIAAVLQFSDYEKISVIHAMNQKHTLLS